MSGTAEGPPMDVAKEAGQEQQQKELYYKKELDRNESVRSRLLAISQGEPVGSVVHLEPAKDNKAIAQPTGKDEGEEFRRKLMSISYVDVPLPAQ